MGISAKNRHQPHDNEGIRARYPHLMPQMRATTRIGDAASAFNEYGE